MTLCFAQLASPLLTTASFAKSNDRPPRHYEFWGGVDFSEQTWLAYSGSTFSPFSDMHSEGLKLRAALGHGQYEYTTRFLGGSQRGTADVTYADVMIGYLWRLDPIIPKLFVGYSFIDHQLPSTDEFTFLNGEDMGLKVQAEIWINLDEHFWTAIDLSWSQAHETRSARLRYGYIFMPEFSVGLEVSFHQDNDTFCFTDANNTCTRLTEEQALQRAMIDNGRIGLFLRHHWDGGEFSATAGLSAPDTDSEQIYGGFNYLRQF